MNKVRDEFLYYFPLKISREVLNIIIIIQNIVSAPYTGVSVSCGHSEAHYGNKIFINEF